MKSSPPSRSRSAGSGTPLRTFGGRYHQHPSRSAMTLVELMAALTLSALLTTSLLGVLTSITRAQQVVLQNHGVPAVWQAQLDEILAWDLENSRTIRLTEAGIQLQGFAGRDLSSRIPIHCPCTIDYEIVAVEKRSHLIRRETHTELSDLDNSLTELICTDVTGIRFGAAGSSRNRLAISGSQEILSEGPLPIQLSVSLLGAPDSGIVYTRSFTRK